MTTEDFKARIQAMSEDASKALLHAKRLVANAVLLHGEMDTKAYQDRRDAVVEMVNEYVDVAYVPEWLEARSIGFLVDEAFRLADLNPAITMEGIVEGLDE